MTALVPFTGRAPALVAATCSQDNPMPPAIPPITDPDLLDSVSALTCAADSYRKAFLLLADRLLVAGGGDNEDFRYVLKKGGDALHLADAIINAWQHQLVVRHRRRWR
jgi:hypothetical protein